MIDSEAVGEPAVRSTGKHQVREPQLANASQALELGGVYQFPSNLVCPVAIVITVSSEYDQPVDRIPDALCPT